MATHLLKELLDTRYFYCSIDRDFRHVIDEIEKLRENSAHKYFAGNPAQQRIFDDVVSGGDIVIDICDMRITSDCTPSIINSIRKGFKFIDTKNAYRNSLLQESMSRHPVPDAVRLPAYNSTTNPLDYIKSLDKNTVYSLPPQLSNLEIALIILATMSRPKLKFALDATHGVIFDTVAEVITVSVLCNYTEFYYNSPEGIEILQLRNGKLLTQRRGYCTIAEACEAGSLVPTVFGKEKLIANPLWEPLVTVCLSAVNASHQSRPKTLDEVLKGET